MADTDLLVVSRGGVEYKITRGELDAYINDGYTIVDSMLFNGTNAYLNRTPSVAGNRKTWTWSGWVKRGSLGEFQSIFSSGDIIGTSIYLFFHSDNRLAVGVLGTYEWDTVALFRDPSAWYHIVLNLDTTQAVENRIKMYVNGEQQTFTSTGTALALNSEPEINATVPHWIGRNTANSADYLDGYISEVNFIDGQALEPSAFGETGDFGEWLPMKYSGTYGTNGFYLEALDSVNLGKDTSGNGNDFINNNVVQVTDTPTDNYAVLSPLASNSFVPMNGNLDIQGNTSWRGSIATIQFPSSGKYYYEINAVQVAQRLVGGLVPIELGIVTSPWQNTIGFVGFASDASAGHVQENLSSSNQLYSQAGTSASIDVISFAVDCDTGNVWFGRNGVFYADNGTTTTSPEAGTNPTFSGLNITDYFAGAQCYDSNVKTEINFGQKDFAHTPPTGFKALSTKNLPDATVVPSESFGVRLRTGTGVEATVSDLGFQPDLLWTKTRSWDDPLITGINHNLHSTLMAQNYSFLQTNTTDPENSTATNYYMTPTSTGYNVGTGDNINQVNHTFVDWLWKAGTEVTNTDGDITTSVSANTTAGFSIVTFTGTGVITDTIGHGLGTTPEMMFVRGRSVGSGWFTYNKTMGNGKFMYLNTTQAETTSSGVWNNTSPTNTVFVTGSASDGVTMVAYCFASVEGYSKIGSYTGNSSTDGPFVYTGFRPAYVLVKNSTSGGLSWVINDTSRDTYNECNKDLFADGANAESNPIPGRMDILSNGFKIRSSANSVNQNGNTCIYMAFAEQPFKNSNAR